MLKHSLDLENCEALNKYKVRHYTRITGCMRARSLQSCPTLCDPMDCSLTGSSVHGILQARTLEWDTMPSSRGSSNLGIEPASLASPALAGGFFTTSAPWEAAQITAY